MIVLQQFLINTPWWVYLIFAYLIYRGIVASQPRVISFSRLFLRISGATMRLLVGRMIHYIYCYKTCKSERWNVPFY